MARQDRSRPSCSPSYSIAVRYAETSPKVQGPDLSAAPSYTMLGRDAWRGSNEEGSGSEEHARQNMEARITEARILTRIAAKDLSCQRRADALEAERVLRQLEAEQQRLVREGRRSEFEAETLERTLEGARELLHKQSRAQQERERRTGESARDALSGIACVALQHPSVPAYTMPGRETWEEARDGADGQDSPGPSYYEPHWVEWHANRPSCAPSYSIAGRLADPHAVHDGTEPGVFCRPDLSATPSYTMLGRDAWRGSNEEGSGSEEHARQNMEARITEARILTRIAAKDLSCQRRADALEAERVLRQLEAEQQRLVREGRRSEFEAETLERTLEGARELLHKQSRAQQERERRTGESARDALSGIACVALQHPSVPAYTMPGRETWEEARDGADAAAADVSPGPIYLPVLSHDSRHPQPPAFTMAARYEAPSATEETPGPAAVGLGHLPRAPAFSLRGRDAWASAAAQIESASPGPQYLPATSGTGRPDVGLAYTLAARFEMQPLPEGPGARPYGSGHMRGAPQYSIQGRDAWMPLSTPVEESPGPAYLVETSGTSRLPRAPAYTMGCRFEAPGMAPGMGENGEIPAADATPAALLVHKPSAPAFSLQGRDAWEKEPRASASTPAPGSYEPLLPKHLPAGPSFSMGAKPRPSELDTHSPDFGPTTMYHLPSAPAYTIAGPARAPPAPPTPGPLDTPPSVPMHLPNAPSYSMRGKAHDPTASSATPAAEVYERPDFRSAPAITMGARTSGLCTVPTPGPGEYAPQPAIGGGAPAFSLGARIPSAAVAPVPGPGEYERDDAFSTPSAPKFSMQGRFREPGYAGPDSKYYDHQGPYIRSRHPSAPAVSIKGKAPASLRAQPAPGPGSYRTSQQTHRGHALLHRPAASGPSNDARAKAAAAAAASAERPSVRQTYPATHKLPPATSYKENVARAAALLSPAQLEQMKAKFSNLRQALAEAETA